jgi:hypothetical protein
MARNSAAATGSADAWAEPVPAIVAEREPESDEPIDEALVADFGDWYLSHSPEWIAEMDELGRKGDDAS